MWLPVTEKSFAIVIYPFNGSSIVPTPHGQDFSLGDVLFVTEECPSHGWLRCSKSNKKASLIPTSYVHRTVKDTETSEITTVVREWGKIWKKLYIDGSDYQLQVIGKAIRELVDGRKLLITSNLTREQSEELKLKLASKIDWGNRKLGLDLVPRDGYKIVGPEVGVVQLYRVHVASVEQAEAARTTLRKKRVTTVPTPSGHHLYMTVRDFNCNLNEDCEVYFSIYDAGRSVFISDRYTMTLPASNSTFIDKLQTISTLFLDLSTHEFTQDLYIVTHILRRGRMFHTDSNRKSTQNYRRPFACGVVQINSSILASSSSGQLSEYNCKLYTSDEKEFYNIHDLIIKHSSKVTLMTGANGLSVALKLFHGDISVIMEENSMLLKGIVATRKIGFPDVIMPGVVRNDLYITILHGEFEKGGKTTGKNISVSIEVVDSNGALIENTVFGAVNSPNYESIILYHNNNPVWNETLRVSVPIEAFASAHIRILYRHCSTKEKNDKKLFGFSFIKLMDDHGTTIKDSIHNLPIYKCEDISKLLPSNYWCVNAPPFPRSSKESMVISTQLVSTKLTQNMDLVSLLKWKQHPEKVKETLVNIANLPGEELVKFLQDVLDVIFAMFIGEDGYSTEYSGDAFIVLINIFTLLENSKFEHFKSVIDFYIHDHFAAALVYKGLLSSVRHYAEVTPRTEKDFIKQIQKCFKTVEYIFKFVVQSRLLFARATGGNMEDSFRRDVQDMFQSFSDLLSYNMESNDELISTQAALLKNLHKIYSHLARVLPNTTATNEELYYETNTNISSSPPSLSLSLSLPPISSNQFHLNTSLHNNQNHQLLSNLIYNLFHSMPTYPSAHCLSPAKLTALSNLVSSELFAMKGPRTLLLPEICRHIRHHLSIRDELKLTSEILLNILHNLHQYAATSTSTSTSTTQSELNFSSISNSNNNSSSNSNNNNNNNLMLNSSPLPSTTNFTSTSDDIETISTLILENLINSVLILERTSSVIVPLVTNLTGLLQQMNEFHYNRIFDEFKDTQQIRNFILRALFVFRDLIKMDVFNPDWATMKLLNCSIILKSIHYFSNAISTHCLKPKEDCTLILEYLNVCISFIIQPGLQLEEFRDNKKAYILHYYGDMRVAMSREILFIWELIEKFSFIPNIVGPILLITLIPENQLRNDTIPLFYDLLIAEFNKTGDFKEVEAELIDKLDTYILEGKSDEDYIQSFNSILSSRVQCLSPDQPFTIRLKRFISSIRKLLEHLYDYRAVPSSDSDNKDKKMQCTNNLLSYYKHDVDNKPMYIKYIYKLIDLHDSSENYAEAGFTLLLHSEMLDWDEDFKAKEGIYLKAINYFDNGKLWECGIPLCKELALMYEANYDYAKLAAILNKESTFFTNILQMHRPDPEYFRVGFFGQGFPLFVRNKEFIYRGLDYEKLSSFMQKLLLEWPQAQVLKNNPVDETIMNGEEQHIQIRSVKPLQNNPETISAPFKIRSFYNTNNISLFQFDRPLKSGDDENVKNMWVERTTLETVSSLPGILRAFQVKSKNIVVLNPVNYACQRIMEVNKNLEEHIAMYSPENNSNTNVNPLSMLLVGVLDAAVMGGLPKYQEAFFNQEYITANRDTLEDVNALSKLINEQVVILDRALTIHGQLVPPGVLPLHNRLLECFNTMKASVNSTCPFPAILKRSDSLRISSSIINTPLPPVPNNNNINNNNNTAATNNTTLNNINNNQYVENNTSNRISSSYGSITFSTVQSDDEDVYSIPTSQPPPIPNRKKKQQQQQQQQSPVVSSGEYIVMPPSRMRELSNNTNINPTSTSTPIVVAPPNNNLNNNSNPTSVNPIPVNPPPPRPPKEPLSRRTSTNTPVPSESGSNSETEFRGAPPVPPKPKGGDQGDSKRSSSNSGNSYKEIWTLKNHEN